MEFVQERVATLHGFTDNTPPVPVEDVAVVIPVKGEDLGRRSLDDVLDTLVDVDPGRVVLSVRGSRGRVSDLRERVGRRSLDVEVLWCNAPALDEALRDAGVNGPTGKGRDVWLALAVAGASHDIVVVHDADARTYDAGYVPKLAWAIDQGYDFAKGYYARIERERFFGRLVRLVWYPLLSVLERSSVAPVVRYLGAFRYPLAGEFAIDSERIPELRLPPRWGLETGMLGEMYNHVGFDGSAQVDLGVHQHDHRPIRGGAGLEAMAAEVVGTLASILEGHGETLPTAEAYATAAIEHLDRYATDAAFNGLRYDRTDERAQIEAYRSVVEEGGRRLDPLPSHAAFSIAPDEIREMGQPADPPRRVT